MPAFRRPDSRLVLASLLAATTGLLGGCYQRVVGVKNAPGYTGPIYEENVKEGNENLFRVRTVTPRGTSYVD